MSRDFALLFALTTVALQHGQAAESRPVLPKVEASKLISSKIHGVVHDHLDQVFAESAVLEEWNSLPYLDIKASIKAAKEIIMFVLNGGKLGKMADYAEQFRKDAAVLNGYLFGKYFEGQFRRLYCESSNFEFEPFKKDYIASDFDTNNCDIVRLLKQFAKNNNNSDIHKDCIKRIMDKCIPSSPYRFNKRFDTLTTCPFLTEDDPDEFWKLSNPYWNLITEEEKSKYKKENAATKEDLAMTEFLLERTNDIMLYLEQFRISDLLNKLIKLAEDKQHNQYLISCAEKLESYQKENINKNSIEANDITKVVSLLNSNIPDINRLSQDDKSAYLNFQHFVDDGIALSNNSLSAIIARFSNDNSDKQVPSPIRVYYDTLLRNQSYQDFCKTNYIEPIALAYFMFHGNETFNPAKCLTSTQRNSPISGFYDILHELTLPIDSAENYGTKFDLRNWHEVVRYAQRLKGLIENLDDDHTANNFSDEEKVKFFKAFLMFDTTAFETAHNLIKVSANKQYIKLWQKILGKNTLQKWIPEMKRTLLKAFNTKFYNIYDRFIELAKASTAPDSASDHLKKYKADVDYWHRKNGTDLSWEMLLCLRKPFDFPCLNAFEASYVEWWYDAYKIKCDKQVEITKQIQEKFKHFDESTNELCSKWNEVTSTYINDIVNRFGKDFLFDQRIQKRNKALEEYLASIPSNLDLEMSLLRIVTSKTDEQTVQDLENYLSSNFNQNEKAALLQNIVAVFPEPWRQDLQNHLEQISPVQRDNLKNFIRYSKSNVWNSKEEYLSSLPAEERKKEEAISEEVENYLKSLNNFMRLCFEEASSSFPTAMQASFDAQMLDSLAKQISLSRYNFVKNSKSPSIFQTQKLKGCIDNTNTISADLFNMINDAFSKDDAKETMTTLAIAIKQTVRNNKFDIPFITNRWLWAQAKKLAHTLSDQLYTQFPSQLQDALRTLTLQYCDSIAQTFASQLPELSSEDTFQKAKELSSETQQRWHKVQDKLETQQKNMPSLEDFLKTNLSQTDPSVNIEDNSLIADSFRLFQSKFI